MNEHYEECPVANLLSIRGLYTFTQRKFPKDYLFAGETHDFTEVVCVVGGRVGVTADKKIYLLTEGQLIVHPPNEFHKIWSDGVEAETIVFSFRAERFPTLPRGVFSLTREQLEELLLICRLAGRAFAFDGISVAGIRENREAEASVVVKRLEIFLLSLLAPEREEVPSYRSQSAENYMRIISAMERSLGTPVNVNELAKMCNLSVSALEKTIHRYSGCGVMSHFNNLRMKRATELLAEGKSVKEVASTLGFSCQNYFSLAYKKWSGKSPSELRRK